MVKKIKTEVIINSIPEKIWGILTDLENYPNWNPFITYINGNLETGNKIIVNIKPPSGRKMTFMPTIITKKENKELVWQGKFLFKGFFDGKHKFELIDNENGTTTFIQSEEFSGIFVKLFNPQKTQNGFLEMNQILKKLAENQ